MAKPRNKKFDVESLCPNVHKSADRRTYGQLAAGIGGDMSFITEAVQRGWQTIVTGWKKLKRAASYSRTIRILHQEIPRLPRRIVNLLTPKPRHRRKKAHHRKKAIPASRWAAPLRRYVFPVLNVFFNLWDRVFDPAKRGADWRNVALKEITRRADPRALTHINKRFVAGSIGPMPTEGEKWKPSGQAAISVVLGTYNRLEALKLAIESIRTNGFNKPYEIIVIDGGSTDGTIAWLAEQKDVILILQHNRDPQTNARRRSWGYFMNLGFKAAEAPWILMISDDCILHPGSIANSLAKVESAEASYRKLGGVAFYFRDWPQDSAYFIQNTMGGMMMVNHGLFSKQALIDVGYANELDYSFYKADSDLSLKLWHKGYEIVDCPTAIVEHLLLPSELLRVGNVKSIEDDRQTLTDKWHGIYTHPEIERVFKGPSRRFIKFSDPYNVAEKFRPLLESDERAMRKN